MSKSHSSFVPALGLHALTPFFDLVAWLMGETRFKKAFLGQAGIESGHEVLDVGCGTGTLALMVAQAHPRARVCATDIDERILAIARDKISRAGAQIALHQASATDLPFATASFDRVLTSLMMHHLSTPQKRAMLDEVRRILRPSGELHVADWGKPHNALMRLAALGFQVVDGGEATRANLRGELPALIAAAGFVDVAETEQWMTPFGTLAFVRARMPA